MSGGKTPDMSVCDIIIPFYQRRPGILANAVASVFAQTHEHWRLIIVDDGSPSPVEDDLSGLTDYQRTRLRIVKKPNGGVSSARNAGLDAVSDQARIVAFLDSDDIWDPGHLARCATALSKPGIDLFWAAVSGDEFSEDYVPVSSVLNRGESEPLLGMPQAYWVRDLRPVLCGPWWRHMHLSCTAITASLAQKVRFRETLRLSEDFAFLMDCAQIAEGAVASDAPGMARGTGDNIWHGMAFDDARLALEKYTMMTLYKSLQRDQALAPEARKILDARIEGRRQQFFWNQVHRLKGRKAPTVGLWMKWIARDPAILRTAFGRLLKQAPRQSRYVIPLEDA
ncbi:MAG: glycosyltransferase family A protein [Pseudomonadota bacterium]